MTTSEQGQPVSRTRKPRLNELVVDPDQHASEIERFSAKIVTPPAQDDGTPSPMCSLWSGAIGDDGYGRFHVMRNGFEYTVKPHRYAVAWKLGIPVVHNQVIEHIVCDNPLCCHAHPDREHGHIWPSTQAANLRRMARKGRGGGSGWCYRKWSGLNRTERAMRSRELRDVIVEHGWDEARIRDVLLRIDPAQTVLFT